MPKGKKANGKKVGLTSAIVKKQKTRKEMNPLFEKRPKNLGSGQNIQKYHRLRQRALLLQAAGQRAILYKQLKVPAAFNQFPQVLDQQIAIHLLKLTHKNRPKTKQKTQRLLFPAAKGTSQLRDHLSSEQMSIQSLPWWRTRRLSCW